MESRGATYEGGSIQTGFKLALVLAPFLLVLVLGMIEWWMRSRGP